jgi:uncharacterized protein YbjT (DUF2867 family)
VHGGQCGSHEPERSGKRLSTNSLEAGKKFCMSRSTIAVTGPEELRLSEAARRVARVLGKHIYVFPAPVWFHRIFARVLEKAMKVPPAGGGTGAHSGRGRSRA